MYFQHDRAPHISGNTWQSTWMSSSLPDGLLWLSAELAAAFTRCHSPLDFHVWCYTKDMVYECKVWREELHNQFLMQDAAMTLMFYVRLQSSWIWNICSPVTVQNWAFWLGLTSGIWSWNIGINSPDTLHKIAYNKFGNYEYSKLQVQLSTLAFLVNALC